jgi:hypothetical protein
MDGVFRSVEAYYTGKLTEHGATPLGVDWSCQATQWLRFVQLLKVCTFDTTFALNDLGCGYGELASFLSRRYPQTTVDYLGIDLSSAMVRRARRRYRHEPSTRFAVGRTCPRQADYTVASGIMNVMRGHPMTLWESFLRAILVDMHRASRRGFAVNFCAPQRPDLPPDQLYCCTPEPWVRFCEDELGCSVEVVDGYGLREFTLLVRQERTCGPDVNASSAIIPGAAVFG